MNSKARAGLAAALLALLAATTSWAKPLDAEERKLYEEAVASLKAGAPTQAIQQFELLSDRGVLSPDISYDRAVAYAIRGRSPRAKPGDLGRSACALSEALTLDPEDAQAQALLDQIDHALSRERSRRGAPSLLARARLSRALVGLLSENTWAVASLVFSAVTTVGLGLNLGTKTHRLRLAGAISLALGLLLGAISITGLLLAMHERRHTSRGVVVAQEAHLLDATGAALSRSQLSAQDRLIPEGARVLVKGRNDRFLQVEWGSTDAYVSPTELQLLPKAP